MPTAKVWWSTQGHHEAVRDVLAILRLLHSHRGGVDFHFHRKVSLLLPASGCIHLVTGVGS